MTKARNEVSSSTRSTWQSNLTAETGNIISPFNTNKIVLSKTVYNRIKFDFLCHVAIYFGKKADGTCVAIALPAYKLDELDSEAMARQWDNIYKAGYVYDLYTGSSIAIADAKTYVANWATNSSNELYVEGFIIPRSNLIDIFENQDEDYCLIDFGLKKDVKLMTQACNSVGTPVASAIPADFAKQVPPYTSYIQFSDM